MLYFPFCQSLNWRDKDKLCCFNIPNLRCLSSNSKIEDAFYNDKLRINGQKLIKKSKSVSDVYQAPTLKPKAIPPSCISDRAVPVQVKVGDVLDLVLSENKDTNTVTVMRVIPRRVFGESSATEKHKVAIRRWKSLELPRNEVLKPWASVPHRGKEPDRTKEATAPADGLKVLVTSRI